MSGWMIYGATGYTGELIAREAARQGLKPILAGRRALAVEALAKELGLPARIVLLDDPAAVAASLDDVTLVLNCAGPFSVTAEPMLRACLAKCAHYLDITGEIAVFELAHSLDARAVAAGIVICPGVGFDVVPTDCVAAMLSDALPGATDLALGFDGPQRMSPGTAKTTVEGIGEGGKIRRAGLVERVPLAYGARQIDFGRGPRPALAIPWGDIATAYYTTGIPNITVYIPTTASRQRMLGAVDALRFVFRSRTVKRFLQSRIDSTVQGPDDAARAAATTWVWGEARAPGGATKTIRITTPDPYALTIDAAVGAVRHVIEGPVPAGSTTPARLLGSRYVLDLPGTALVSG
jgi:short subunit dehydrogenase-like uncharacterized protein